MKSKTNKATNSNSSTGVLKKLENMAQICAETIKMKTVFDYFSGPEISKSLKFFENNEELNAYVQDLY